MLKVKKIKEPIMNLNVQGQSCDDDCTEHNKLVGKSNRNTKGCVYYDTIYTAKGNIFF